MRELKPLNLGLSERCRVLADECRLKARSFRNDKARIQMLQLAADYERKARAAEALEESLRRRHDVDLPLAQKTSEAFEEQSRKTSVGK